jgi:hypothetical protein
LESEQEIQSPRFFWVAALTMMLSVLAVLCVRSVAIRILHPKPTFQPLAFGPPIFDTVICTIVAILAFITISAYPNCIRLWRYVAGAVLVLSFIPDMILAISHGMGGGWPEACALMIMHVVVWAVCITVLPSLAFTKLAPTEDRQNDPLSIL